MGRTNLVNVSMNVSQTKNIRVLHIINGQHYSGGERIQDILGHSLPEFGFDVGFACVKPDLFPRVYTARSSPIHCVPMRHLADFGVLNTLVNIVKKGGYRLIHTHIARTALVGGIVSAIAKIPMVHHIHGETLYESPNRLKCLGAAIIERVGLIACDRAIACSEGMKQYGSRIGLRDEIISVVPNGIPQYGPLEKRPLPANEWVFGMTALFRPRKGTEFLLEAIRMLHDRGKLKIRFRGIGDFISQEYQVHIKRLVSDLRIAESVEWVPFTKNVHGELGKLDCFVLPSEYGEGLPIAILEAMASGLPVITTRIPGNKEVIRDGIDGYLCEPADARSLVQCIEKVTRSGEEWQTLRRNAHTRQREIFSDRAMSSAVAQIYREVLSQ